MPLISIITPKLTEIRDFISKFVDFQSKYEEHIKSIKLNVVDIQSSINVFFGDPLIVTPKLTEIKDFISKFITFQLKCEEYIKQFESIQGNVIDLQSSANSFFGDPPIITIKLTEIMNFISKFVTFQSKYEEHVQQFKSIQEHIADLQSSTNTFFGVPPPSIIEPKLVEIKNFMLDFVTYKTNHGNEFKSIQSSANELFGNPPIIVPKLIEVKDFMSKVAAFQTQYNDHIKQYTSTQGTVAKYTIFY